MAASPWLCYEGSCFTVSLLTNTEIKSPKRLNALTLLCYRQEVTGATNQFFTMVLNSTVNERLVGTFIKATRILSEPSLKRRKQRALILFFKIATTYESSRLVTVSL